MDLHPTFLVLIAVAPTVAVLAVSFVQFLGRRTVDREDKDKENIQKRVDALGTRLTSIDHQLISIQSDMKQNFAQLENVRESLVGVNLDEETANLVKFQHSYAASAKVLQVADENMQTILSTFR